MSGPGFVADALEQRFAFVEACPRGLLGAAITLPVGTLEARVAGVRAWYDALLGGYLPPAGVWPGAPIDVPVRRALEAMGLARFCLKQPELVDALMGEILAAFGRQQMAFDSDVVAELAELERLQRVRQKDMEAELARAERRAARAIQRDAECLRRLRGEAEVKVSNKSFAADSALIATWGERARAWAEVVDVFGDLGQMLGRGWDMSTGVLKHTGWLDLLRLRELVEKLPELREIVRALGRLKASDDGTSVAEKILVPVQRLEVEMREIRTPHVPGETRGIERSGKIERMLANEAAMLGHPKMRLLWHARRAEGALLTYRIEGTEVERMTVMREVTEEIDGERPRPESGPILAIIDTSGSMHGMPELVAKAIVLEAVRTAHAEKRQCFLYAYSGSTEVIEHELDLSPEGIGRLLAFLGFSFGGGNDEAGMMAKVVARLQEEHWKKADVLFVSDGEWPAPYGLVQSVRQQRENGTRFHGVQIGNRGRTGLHAVCDPVHIFKDWTVAGGWR